jgi:starch-binding outer membrane protein, SusD/RagB family
MNNSTKISLSILAAFGFFSCNPDLLETIPSDRISSAIYWQTDQDAIFGANAIYLQMDNAWNFVHWDAMSDIGHVTLQWRDESFLEIGSYESRNSRILNDWNRNFSGIQSANIFLDNVDRVETLNPTLIERLKGEVKFLRAFYYIQLVSLFGDVPLLTKTTTLEESRNLTRTPVSEVWDFISNELTEAAIMLPITQADVGRVTKGAALALKARALLYAGRYPEAATAAKEVMDLDVYSLYPSYEKLFSYEAQNNQEVIFDRQYAINLSHHNIFNLTTPNSIWPQRNSFVPTKQAVDAYQMADGKTIDDPDSDFNPFDPYSNRDPRLHYTIFTIGALLPNGEIYDSRPNSGTADAIGHSENSTATGYNVRKYLNVEDMNQPDRCGINLIFIRYAEILLTYAEAKIEANQIDQSVFDAINQIRQRPDVNMPAISGVTSQSQLREIVRQERSVELAFEGFRFFDIRRWRIAENVIPGMLLGMTYVNEEGTLETISVPGFVKLFRPDRDYLWPIPLREIELNRNLTQNPNW